MRQLSFRSRLFTIKKAIVFNQKVKSDWRERRIRLRPKPAPAEAVRSGAKRPAGKISRRQAANFYEHCDCDRRCRLDPFEKRQAGLTH
jgi:hypothetical protein